MWMLWLGILFVAALVVAAKVSLMRGNRRRARLGYWVGVSGSKRKVEYHEGAASLSLDFDLSGPGYPDTLYVPTEEEWDRSVPGWARGRRTEIMERIIGELGTKRWVYDGFPP